MTPNTCTIVRWRRMLGMVALSLCGSLAGNACGGDPPIAYRRILVPAESPPAWPRDGDKFLPVESRDFDAWIAAANLPPAEVRIDEAEYQARLEGRRLADGRGTWRVALRGTGPAYLPLGGTSLVVRDAEWLDEHRETAQLGWWASSKDKPMSFGLRVPRSGELQFAWHTQPVQATGGTLEFPLRLPAAARTRLILDLPNGMRPVLEGSVVLESPAGQAPAAPGDWHRWVIAVGASQSAVLRIEDPQSEPTDQAPAASVRERCATRSPNAGSTWRQRCGWNRTVRRCAN